MRGYSRVWVEVVLSGEVEKKRKSRGIGFENGASVVIWPTSGVGQEAGVSIRVDANSGIQPTPPKK